MILRAAFSSGLLAAFLAVVAGFLPVPAHAGATNTDASGLRLLVVEQAGCAYCAQFHREIVPAYNASPESEVAPLVFVDLRGPMPEGVALSPRPFVTPTFVLIRANGAEVGRITGYPGDIFFWSLLEEILNSAAELDESSAAGG